jgi:hypothetical protein
MNPSHGESCRDSRKRNTAVALLLAVALCAAGLSAPLAARADGPIAGNLARNWGLESFYTYDSYNGYDLSIANEWIRFQVSGQDARFMTDLDYADLFSSSGAIPRHLEGNNCQNLWLGHPFVAGIYQQIAVTPGKPYAAKAMWLSAVGSTVPSPTGKMLKQTGIDPTGGTNAGSTAVVWGEENGRNKSFLDTRGAARATSSTITVFLKLNNIPETKPDWDAAWIDAVVVEEAPECRATSPAGSATGTFTIQWSGQKPPNGDLTGVYDVDYRDGASGTWTRWKDQTSATSAVFTGGQTGHNYFFRARAWARYSDTVDLYGAFSPDGDTSTRVGNAVAGKVDRLDAWRVPGALVSLVGTGVSATADSDGNYLLSVPGAGAYELAVSAPGFASPPTAAIGVTSTSGTLVVPLTLRNVGAEPVVNGDFQSALGGEWDASSTGGGAPEVQTDVFRGGGATLALRRGAAIAGQSEVRQTINLSDVWSPILSFYASMPVVNPGDSLVVGTFAGTTYTPLATLTGAPGWQHYHVHLAGNQSFTGPLGIFFRATQATATPMQAYLDEVSVGKGPGGPLKSFLPLISDNN